MFVRCQGCGEKCATQFPEANALGCAMNASLWHAIGDAISTEARAFYRVMPLNGLSFFAPQLNMAANPLWGRNMECPGEDPHVTSVFAREYVRGMQGDHPSGILKTVCTPKHFVGQLFEGDGSNPWNNGTTVNRQSNDTRYPLHDLEKYYLPAFKSAMIDAGAGSVLCAYRGPPPAPPPPPPPPAAYYHTHTHTHSHTHTLTHHIVFLCE
jgi:beta-glucosidase-like glycosyl hydrolase